MTTVYLRPCDLYIVSYTRADEHDPTIIGPFSSLKSAEDWACAEFWGTDNPGPGVWDVTRIIAPAEATERQSA